MTFDQAAAERLREERKRLQLRQLDAAAQVGCEQNQWSKYERGEVVPGGHVLAAFARQGADMNYLLSGKRGGGIDDSGEIALLDDWRSMQPREQWLLQTLAALLCTAGGSAAMPEAQTRITALLRAFAAADTDQKLAIEIAAGLKRQRR